MPVGADHRRTRRLARAQRRQHRLDDADQRLGLPVAPAGTLVDRHGAAFEAFEISEHQLGLDRLDIADRVDRALDMDDIVVAEAAHDMGDRIDLADMAEKLVAQPLAAGGAAHQPGDVDEFELGRDDLCRFRQARADREPLVGHRDPPDIGLDRAERVICRLGRFGRGQGVEEGGLADIGQADDAAAETHRPRVAAALRPRRRAPAAPGGEPPRS